MAATAAEKAEKAHTERFGAPPPGCSAPRFLPPALPRLLPRPFCPGVCPACSALPHLEEDLPTFQ